jgi:hypothetical protein
MTNHTSFRRSACTRNSRRLGLEALEDRRVFAYELSSVFGLGAEGCDLGREIAVDVAGNKILAASFTSASIDLDPSAASNSLTNAGGADGLVAKYDSAGALLWGVHFASSANNYVNDVVTDGAGNLLVAGSFTGSLTIGTPQGITQSLTNNGVSESFLAKLSPTGDILWVTKLAAGAAPRTVQDIAVDSMGNAYITGGEGNYSFFVAKYTSGGASAWTKVVSEGTGVFWGIRGVYTRAHSSGIAVDGDGNVHLAGAFVGSGVDFNPDPKKSAKLASTNGNSDAFVMKMTTAGAFVWVGSMGGYGFDSGIGITVDANQNVLVSGYNDSSTFGDYDPGRGSLSLPGGGFVLKFDANRNLLWGRGSVGQFNVAVDNSGSSFVTNETVITKLDSAGNIVWSAAAEGSYQDIALGPNGTLVLTGFFRGTGDFDPSTGTYLLTSMVDANGAASNDIFVAEWAPLPALQATRISPQSKQAKPVLFASDTQATLAEALARWQASGVNTDRLGDVDVQITNLGGTILGLAQGNTIWLDDNAAGWGWFVDKTPWDDGEFLTPGNQGEAGRMDLLSVVMHELGHLLDYHHEADGVMAETLATGTRLADHLSLTDAVFEEPGARQDSWFVASLADFVESSRTGKRRR